MGGSGKVVERPLLFDTLAVLLPTTEETYLLRTCTQTGQRGRAAWRDWREHATNVREAVTRHRRDIRSLFPLLYRTVQRNGAAVDDDTLTYLRTAYFREELRVQAYRRICGDVLTALGESGIPVIVLGGAALSETVYRDWATRHSGSLELLLEESDIPHAQNRLEASGMSRSGETTRRDTGVVRFVHASGLPIELRGDPFDSYYYRAPLAAMWTRSQAREIAGARASVLGSADMLASVLGGALCRRRQNGLQWVCDAWHVIDRCPELNWDDFIDGLRRSHLTLPGSVMLSYLAEELDARIPSPVLRQLASDASRTALPGNESAVHAARLGGSVSYGDLYRRSEGLWARAVVLKSMLLPSPKYLGWRHRACRAWLLPLCYVWRPLRYIARRAGRAAARAREQSSTMRPRT